MGLYDGYQLANSQGIKTYQGSTVPEMVQVSQQLQDRYDKTLDTMDAMGRFMNTLQALPQDKPELRAMAQEYRNKLSGLAQKKDLENSLRETTLLANNLSQDYAPFAERMQQRAALSTDLSKRVEDGKITNDTYKQAMDMHDKLNGPIQTDVDTGRRIGKYAAQPISNDIDFSKKVDDWYRRSKPVVNGESVDFVNGQWIGSQSHKVVDMAPEKLRQIVNEGIANDPEARGWIKQQQQLGTYNLNYTPKDLEGLDLGQTVEQRLQRNPDGSIAVGKDKQPLTTNISLGQAIHERTAKGEDLNDIMRSYASQNILDNIILHAHNYAIGKYAQHDVEIGKGLRENSYEKDQIPVFPVNMLQPVPGSQYSHPTEIEDAIKNYDNANSDAYQKMLAWMQLNNVSPVDASGKPANPLDASTKFVDAKGNEKTSEGRKFVDMMHQANDAAQQLRDKQASLMKKAGFQNGKADGEIAKQAKEAYDFILQNGLKSYPNGTTPEVEADLKRQARDAYDLTMAQDPRYNKFKQYMAEDAQNNSVPVGFKKFDNEKVNKAIEGHFKDTNLNLGFNNAVQGMEWASGESAGKPLDADSYKKIVGNASFAGAGIDADGKYKMLFKAGPDTTDKNGKPLGDNVLVKIPAYPGIAEEMVKQNLIGPAEQYIAQAMGAAHTSTNKSTRIQLGTGMFVDFRQIQPSDKSSYYNNPDANYIITYYGKDGKSKEVAASSIDEAAQGIIQTLQNHKEDAPRIRP